MDKHMQSETADWFEEWFGSPYYKILYQNHDDKEAHQFIDNLVAHLKPEAGARMLDIACGEGRFARHLAEIGFDVTGIDLSEPSIAAASKFENGHLHFYVQDMRFLFYSNYFQFAFNFFTSFGYFKYDRDNRLAAKAFTSALKTGGILVIDYLNSHMILKQLVPQTTIERGGYTFNIKKRVHNSHIIKDISFYDGNGVHREYQETVAAFVLADFTALFPELELLETFGDYKLNPFAAETSPRLIMVFKKK